MLMGNKQWAKQANRYIQRQEIDGGRKENARLHVVNL
jgi:hypothetical protein